MTSSESDELGAWIDRCQERWHALTDSLPDGDPRRYPYGYHWFAYQIRGRLNQVPLTEFLEVLRRTDEVRYTGWPPFLVPADTKTKLCQIDGTVECWLGRSEGLLRRGAGNSDFWRISPDGFAFLLRGYQEDDPCEKRCKQFKLGESFDVIWPIWRAGEVLLHAERLAKKMVDGPATVVYRSHYTGLQGRQLAAISSDRELHEIRTACKGEIIRDRVVQVDTISPNLPEIVQLLLAPLYDSFSSFELTLSLVHTELKKMYLRKNK